MGSLGPANERIVDLGGHRGLILVVLVGLQLGRGWWRRRRPKQRKDTKKERYKGKKKKKMLFHYTCFPARSLVFNSSFHLVLAYSVGIFTPVDDGTNGCFQGWSESSSFSFSCACLCGHGSMPWLSLWIADVKIISSRNCTTKTKNKTIFENGDIIQGANGTSQSTAD